MDACGGWEASQGYLQGAVRLAECQAHDLVVTGFRTLSAPSGPVGLAITTGLTLYVAIWGWGLLLGRTPSLASLILAIGRMGLVLTLSLQWPAYEALVYRPALDAPRQLAGTIAGDPTKVMPETLAQRVQKLHDRVLTAARISTVDSDPSVSQDELRQSQIAKRAAINQAGVLILLTGLAAGVWLPLTLGAWLAIGPVFILLGLFTPALRLVRGWAGVIIGLAASSAAAPLLILSWLAMAEPQAQALAGGLAVAPSEVAATAWSGVLGLALVTLAGLATGLQAPRAIGWAVTRIETLLAQAPRALAPARPRPSPPPPVLAQDRAVWVAASVERAMRRDSLVGRPSLPGAPQRAPHAAASVRPSPSRRTAPRVSGAHTVRDRR